jgi:preprotein translocase subunit SecG
MKNFLTILIIAVAIIIIVVLLKKPNTPNENTAGNTSTESNTTAQ